MGACASVPKGFKAGGTAPEKPREETAAETPPEASDLKAEEEEEKQAVECSIDDKSKNDSEVVSVKDDVAKSADDQDETTKADSAVPVKEEDKKVEAPGYVLPTPKEDGEKKSSKEADVATEEALTGR